MKKREEEKSYSLHFFVAVLLLIITFIWLIWWETEALRPWKDYQKKYYKLVVEGLKKKLDQKETEFSSDKAQKEYKELKRALEKAKTEFESPPVQTEHKKTRRELADVSEELKVVRLEFQKLRARHLEVEYNYIKHGKEEDKQTLEGLNKEIAILDKKIKQLEAAKGTYKAKLARMTAPVDELTRKINNFTSDIDNLKEQIVSSSNQKIEIKQIHLPDLDRTNRCQSCHMAIDRKGFEGFPEPFKTHVDFEIFIDKHPVEKFGCTSCHDGQGRGLTFYDAGHSPGTKDQEDRWRQEYGWKPISHWEEPIFQGDFVQSSCRRCHSLEDDIPRAPVLSEGINLFKEFLGCVNCHLVKGYEDINKIGPDLSKVGSKVNPSWLFRWVKDPKWHHKKSRMPNFKLSDQEATSVTSFLMSLNGDESWKTYRLKEGILGNSALITKGRELVSAIGCNGCHTIGDIVVYENKTRDVAPILTNIGNKTTPEWVLNWLLDPTRYLAKALMPNFSLTYEEAEAIAAYLYSLRDPEFEEITGLTEKIAEKGVTSKGLRVISDYGCYACHDIPGTEKLGRVGAELSNFGNKDLGQLAFGYAKEVKRSWFGFMKAKLKTPRIFETEVIAQKMPDFGLSDEELHALTVLLKSFVDEEIPKEFTKEISPNYADIQKGRKLIKKYNCIGCHEVVKGWGGENISVALRPRYDEREAKSYAPPPLMGEGAKVQSEWLFKFIHEPFSIRPWLHLRMPTFNLIDDQVNSIVRYFQSVSEQNLLYHFWKEKDYTDEEKKELKTLFDMLQCIKCHQFGKGGEAVSAAELAPDLSLTKERLKPKWVKDWLNNPQSLQPGTKMPNFFIDIDEEDGEVTELLPEPEEKIDLILNYLYSLE